MKKILIIVISLLLFVYIYYNTPARQELVQEKFQEYLTQNIPNYKDYEIYYPTLYNGVDNRRGYAGKNHYYESECVHKKYGMKFYIRTSGFDIVSDYEFVRDDIEKEIKYIDLAINLYQSQINKPGIKLKSFEFPNNDDFYKLNPSKESILNNIDKIKPKIIIDINKINYKKLLDTNELIKKMFSNEIFYYLNYNNKDIKYNNRILVDICLSSSDLNKYHSYEDFFNR